MFNQIVDPDAPYGRCMICWRPLEWLAYFTRNRECNDCLQGTRKRHPQGGE